MFNPLRFLTKCPSTPYKWQRPVSLVLYKHSKCSIGRRWSTIFANTFERPITPYNKRYKRTKQYDEESDDDLNLEEDDTTKLMKFRTSTMRMDFIMKQALGKSRNKIEVAFYENRIRVNGEKVTKKSQTLEVGDEVDLVKGPSPQNSDFLLVSRIEILSVKFDDNELEVKLRKFKNLLINNYENK